MKFLVVIPGGFWQLPLIRAAQNCGHTVIVVDSDPDAPGLGIADYQIVSDLSDCKMIEKEIRTITNTIVGAVSFCSDVGISLAFYLSKAFAVETIQFSDPQNFVSKVRQRLIWSNANVLQPNFDSYSDIDSALISFDFRRLPVVVKPVDSSGSRGVTILHEHEDLRKALDHAMVHSRNDQIIVEDFMSGVEFTVEVFAFNGKIEPILITQKAKIQNGPGTVSGYLRALSPSNPIYPRIAELSIQAYSALDLCNGPGHLELIADVNSGPIGVVEAAARGGGFGLSSKLMLEVTGFDLINETLKSIAGSTTGSLQLNFKPGALFFMPTQKGVRQIVGLEDVELMDGVDITVLASIGTSYEDPKTDADRLCAIVVTAESEADLDFKIDQIREILRFVFDD